MATRKKDNARIVLLVEDQADAGHHFRHILSASGFDVVHAGDGAEALAHISAGAGPAIVVADLQRRGEISAADLCRRFGVRGVPVIALTAVTASPEHQRLSLSTCSAVLVEPVTPEALLAEIRRILMRIASATSDP